MKMWNDHAKLNSDACWYTGYFDYSCVDIGR